MLHLAQVKTKELDGRVKLQLLAQQKTEYAWVKVSEKSSELTIEPSDPGDIQLGEGLLVLVDLSPTRQVEKIHDAIPWVLEIVEQYLTLGVTPDVLQEEGQRAEQWRQSLTLQSQELGRRSIEMEARRDQIQELEENLKQEKLRLEALAAQLQPNVNHSGS